MNLNSHTDKSINLNSRTDKNSYTDTYIALFTKMNGKKRINIAFGLGNSLEYKV